MDIATIIGLITCSLFIFFAIKENIGAFIHPPSMMIVFGGTIGSVFIRYPLNKVFAVIAVTKKAFINKIEDPADMIKTIISLSVEAKKNGILSLEKVNIENTFLKKGIQLAIDGVEPELIESVLNIDIAATSKRHDTGKSMLMLMGDAAPAFGMIGTLIGLVLMLGNMDDPKSIGPSMAVALITTLYGSIASNIICFPLADKLDYYHQQEMLIKSLIVSGILSIGNGDHPAVVQEKLTSYLNPAAKANIGDEVK